MQKGIGNFSEAGRGSSNHGKCDGTSLREFHCSTITVDGENESDRWGERGFKYGFRGEAAQFV